MIHPRVAYYRREPRRGEWRKVWFEDWGWGWERDGMVVYRTRMIRRGYLGRGHTRDGAWARWRLWVAWCVEDGGWVRSERWHRDDREEEWWEEQ